MIEFFGAIFWVIIVIFVSDYFFSSHNSEAAQNAEDELDAWLTVHDE